MSKAPKEREFDVYFCPGDAAMLRPAVLGRPARSMSQAARTLKRGDWQEHQAYLDAKRKAISDWAHATFSPAIAHDMERFLRTSEIRCLASLTASETSQLLAKLKEANAVLADKMQDKLKRS